MPSDRCFVAHADILGFRSMVRRNPEAAWTTLSELAEIRNYLSRLSLMRIEVAAPELLIDRVSSVMFSDTIMLFTKSESDVDLQAILIACCELLHKAMFKRVPTRIGVSGGEFFFNQKHSMYSGPALIDAYDLGESAQWLGIVASQSIWAQAVAAQFKSGNDDAVVETVIPTKTGILAGHAVNWPAPYRHDFKISPPISVELFYSQFKQIFGPLELLPECERSKYVNTTSFINERLMRA